MNGARACKFEGLRYKGPFEKRVQTCTTDQDPFFGSPMAFVGAAGALAFRIKQTFLTRGKVSRLQTPTQAQRAIPADWLLPAKSNLHLCG